jgi:HEAT repeat protein
MTTMARRGPVTDDVIEEIFAKTLVGSYEDHAPWTAVNELQHIGTREVFDKAVEWCRSADPLKRARAVDVLAQLGRTADHPENAFPVDSFLVIASLIKTEHDLRPLGSEIFALGHIGNPRAVRMLCRFQKHPDPEIRFALACALGNFADDPMAVDALVELTRDADEDVRDWATFGIGTLSKIDNPAIRAALLARLEDPSEDPRHEAIAGLARLKDLRVLPALLLALEQENVPETLIEAASDILDLSETAAKWKPSDYASALRERFLLDR